MTRDPETLLRVAVAQLEVALSDDAENARAQAVETAAGALRAGADVVVLPELAVPGYTTNTTTLAELAEPIPGPTTDLLTDVARQAGGLVVVGLAESRTDVVFNTAVAISGDGVIAQYRKLHLFDKEKGAFAPGDLGLPVVDTPFGRIGLCICYDLRFPEVARILALRDADLVCAPAAWVPGFDRGPSEVPGQVQGVIVQANLNQIFVACASQVGQGRDDRFLGNSVVVGPFGELALGPLSSAVPEVVAVNIELDDCRVARCRSELITPRADRRTDVYGIAYDGELL